MSATRSGRSPVCEQMDGVLHGNWRHVVGEEDVMLCCGDIALAGSLKPIRLDRVTMAPGRKVLVLGNHDVHRGGMLGEAGFQRMCAAAVRAGVPPLVFSHPPLTPTPAGAVNVHGHSAPARPAEPGALERERRTDRVSPGTTRPADRARRNRHTAGPGTARRPRPRAATTAEEIRCLDK